MNLSLCLLIALAAVGDQEDHRKQVVAPIQPGIRPYAQMDRDIDAFVRREVRAETDADRIAAIEDLCGLFEELKRDPRLARSGVLQGYKAKVHGRLIRIKRELEGDIKRRERRQEKGRGDQRSNSGGIPLPGQEQQPDESDQIAAATQALASQYPLLSSAGGGPSPLFYYAAGSYGGGTVADYGDDLVTLIQRTIEPEFWDVNGGPGSIFFYRPLNALVVRATSEVHRELGGGLGALRKAGGR